MADNWDDDGDNDDWDVDDDELEKKMDDFGLKDGKDIPMFQDDEEDLAIKEKEEAEKAQQASLRKKGNALAAKKQAEAERREELEIARQAMLAESEMQSKMTPDERRALEQRKIEEADNALTDDLFGAVDRNAGPGKGAMNAGDKVDLKDIKDHLKHGRKVAECFKGHKNVYYTTSFFKEAIQQSKDILDDDAVTELIKTLNVIKNDKVTAAKRKVKGQAQKAKKDKAAEARARKIQIETFGDNDQYDEYDAIGDQYEDDFF